MLTAYFFVNLSLAKRGKNSNKEEGTNNSQSCVLVELEFFFYYPNLYVYTYMVASCSSKDSNAEIALFRISTQQNL